MASCLYRLSRHRPYGLTIGLSLLHVHTCGLYTGIVYSIEASTSHQEEVSYLNKGQCDVCVSIGTVLPRLFELKSKLFVYG
jgi:hypothetical protein